MNDEIRPSIPNSPSKKQAGTLQLRPFPRSTSIRMCKEFDLISASAHITQPSADLDLMERNVPMPPAYDIDAGCQAPQCQLASIHKHLPMRNIGSTNPLQPEQQLFTSLKMIQVLAGFLAKLKSSDLDECISCVKRVKPLISNKASIAADQIRCAEKVIAEGSADEEVLARQELGRIVIERDLQLYVADLKSFDVICNHLDELRVMLQAATTEAENRDRHEMSPQVNIDATEPH